MALLVTSQFDHTVREYDGTTGAFVKVAASGGALGDPLGVVIGLDGNLLVSDGQTNQVKRYDSATGAFIDVFASTNLAGPDGHDHPRGRPLRNQLELPSRRPEVRRHHGCEHRQLCTLARQPQPAGREGQSREQPPLRALLQRRHRRDIRSHDHGVVRPADARW